MIIKELQLKNYRNYDDLDIRFSDKLNILIGDNAQGKTNILEAIYVLAVTKSYLGVSDKNLIKLGSKVSIVKSVIVKDGMSKNLEVLINDNGKKVKINDKEIRKLSDYVSKFRVILFSPDNIRMIKDGPGVRRKFLNVEISQISNKYVKLLNDFNNVLHQRNEFLRIIGINNSYDSDYLDILNRKFSELAVQVCLMRKDFIEKINNELGDIYKEITDYDNLMIKYGSSVVYDECQVDMVNNLVIKLEKSFDKDRNYGITSLGPQRDDFYFYLDGKNISLYGSQGQLRVAVLALKLAEIPIFTKDTGETPVVLLDDIFSELDFGKKNRLIKYITTNIQTIITTTDINLIDEELVRNACVYTIKGGKLVDSKRKQEGEVN